MLNQRLSRQRASLTEVYDLAYPRPERRDGIINLPERVAISTEAAGFGRLQVILLSRGVAERLIVKLKIAAPYISGMDDTLVGHS